MAKEKSMKTVWVRVGVTLLLADEKAMKKNPKAEIQKAMYDKRFLLDGETIVYEDGEEKLTINY